LTYEHEAAWKADGLIKILFARGTKDSKAIAWAYVGSANLSESAWGKVVKDRTRKEPKINCRNWECGVVFPVDLSADSSSEMPTLDVFAGRVDVPFRYPAEEYGKRKPWFFKEG